MRLKWNFGPWIGPFCVRSGIQELEFDEVEAGFAFLGTSHWVKTMSLQWTQKNIIYMPYIDSNFKIIYWESLIYARLNSNSLCSQGRPWIYGPPASTPQYWDYRSVVLFWFMNSWGWTQGFIARQTPPTELLPGNVLIFRIVNRFTRNAAFSRVPVKLCCWLIILGWHWQKLRGSTLSHTSPACSSEGTGHSNVLWNELMCYCYCKQNSAA